MNSGERNLWLNPAAVVESLKPNSAREVVGEIYQHLRAPVYGYLQAGLNSPNDAEDLTQEVFVRLYLELRRGGRIGNLRSWVFSVAHNLAMDSHRAESRDRLRAGKEEAVGALNPEELLLDGEKHRKMGTALKRLSARERQCLELRAEGLRYREIAGVLGVSVSAVQSFLSRAIKTEGGRVTRYGRLLEDVLRKHRHASEQEIIGFLDGELTPRQTEWVRRHLEGCWSCRTASEAIGQTVTGFVEFRKRLLALRAERRSGGWPSLEARLRDLPDEPARRLSSRFLVVPLLGLLALTFLFFRLTSTAPVSAAAVLERARRAEQGPAARNGLLTYKKLAMRRRAGSEAVQTAVYEVWTDGPNKRIRHAGAEPLLVEVEEVFAANGRRLPPLSASGFDAWRNGVRKKREEVLAGRNAAAELLTVKTEAAGPLEVNAIREGQIVIRTDTWVPVAESFSVAGKDRERLYEFEAVESRLVDRLSIPGEEPAPPKSASRLPARQPGALVESPGDTEAGSDSGLLGEIAAHYALHRTGVCLDGTVEISSSAGGIVVRGALESERRKTEMEHALADINEALKNVFRKDPAVRFQIQVPNVASSAFDAGPAAGGDPMTIQSRPSPLSGHLREYFEANPGAGTPSERAANLAKQAVSHGRELRRNSWAVRRLAERFADSAELGRSAPSRWLLEVMIREHASALEAETAALKHLLDPLLLSMGSSLEPGATAENRPPPADSWKAAGARVFSGQQEVEILTRELFAGSGEAPQHAATGSRLRARLTALQNQTKLLSAQAAKNLAKPHSEEIIP